MKTYKKRIIVGAVLMLLCQLLFAGCKKSPGEQLPYGEMKEDFQFIIQDIFTIKNSGKSGVVVTGVNENSPLYVGTEVVVISETGTTTPTVISYIEEYQKGLTEGVPEKTNIGILLEGLTSEDISVGDKIVLSGTK